MPPSTLLGAIGMLAGSAMATDWHFLVFSPPDGQQFTALAGDMVVPELPSAAIYYLWPGLQPTDNSGVYQNVLDGRSGTWFFGSGWCCSNPSLPWGSGFSAYEGDVVTFNNTEGASEWTSTITRQGTSDSVTNSFPLNSKSFNQAVFAIELDGVTWDFGPLTFENVVIRSTGSDTSFCNSEPSNYNNATNYSITGLSTVTGDGYVDCYIQQLVLENPTDGG